MTGRYATAYEQIRAILESRTQADPILNANDISDELTCWPIPPLRTIRRYMEHVRIESEKSRLLGHRGQTARKTA